MITKQKELTEQVQIWLIHIWWRLFFVKMLETEAFLKKLNNIVFQSKIKSYENIFY